MTGSPRDSGNPSRKAAWGSAPPLRENRHRRPFDADGELGGTGRRIAAAPQTRRTVFGSIAGAGVLAGGRVGEEGVERIHDRERCSLVTVQCGVSGGVAGSVY